MRAVDWRLDTLLEMAALIVVGARRRSESRLRVPPVSTSPSPAKRVSHAVPGCIVVLEPSKNYRMECDDVPPLNPGDQLCIITDAIALEETAQLRGIIYQRSRNLNCSTTGPAAIDRPAGTKVAERLFCTSADDAAISRYAGYWWRASEIPDNVRIPKHLRRSKMRRILLSRLRGMERSSFRGLHDLRGESRSVQRWSSDSRYRSRSAFRVS